MSGFNWHSHYQWTENKLQPQITPSSLLRKKTGCVFAEIGKAKFVQSYLSNCNSWLFLQLNAVLPATQQQSGTLDTELKCLYLCINRGLLYSMTVTCQ